MKKKKIYAPDDTVYVVAIDKNTGFSVTSTSCDFKDAERYAKYYRRIKNYCARIMDEDELNEFLEREYEVRNKNRIWMEYGRS